MKDKAFLTVVLILLTTTAVARQLSPSEALGRMQTLSSAKGMGGVTATSNYSLAYTSKQGDVSTYYVFNRSGADGFVVLSADDCMPAILMESDDASQNGSASSGNTFDINNIPDGMKWWLAQYDKVISQYVAEGRSYVTQTNYAEIHPLLGLDSDEHKTFWYQTEPYNNLCPSYNGERAPTGCVATAMAQVMRYYKYPDQGKGSKKYDYTFNYYTDSSSEESSVSHIAMKDSADFESHTYQWDKMIDKYVADPVNYTDEQASAVATLMHDCGVSVGTMYSNEGSVASSYAIAAALVQHFKYNASAQHLPRCLYSDVDWEDKLYAELQDGHPVIYSGYLTFMDGHVFVCDGYKDGRYHMNWGWNGYRNSYVLLVDTETEEAIAPEPAEGQSNHGLKYSQSAIFNVRPVEGGTVPTDIKLVSTEALSVYTLQDDVYKETAVFSRNDWLHMVGEFINYYCYDRDYEYGIKLQGTNATFYLSSSKLENIRPGYPRYELNIQLSDVNIEGDYTVTPIYKDITNGDTEWHDMPMCYGISAPVITINGYRSHLQITEMPVLTNNGNTLSKFATIYKTNGLIDLNISLKVCAIQNVRLSDHHRLYAYIYSYDQKTCDAYLCSDELTDMSIDEEKNVTLTHKYNYIDNTDDLNGLPSGLYYVSFYDNYETDNQQVRDNLSDAKYHNFYVNIKETPATDIMQVTASKPETPSAEKILRNGRLLILRGNSKYNASGQQVK